MDLDDMIYEMGTFLTTKELFIYSSVSPQWNKNLLDNKKKRMKVLKEEVSASHYCNNICPCALESIFEQYMNDFFLKRYICRMISRKVLPLWLSELLE